MLTRLHRQCIRRALDLGLEQAVQGLRQVVVNLGGIEIKQQLLTLCIPQDRQVVKGLVRRVLQGLHQLGQRHLHITADPLCAHLGRGQRGEVITITQVIDVQGQRIVGAPVIGQGLHAFPGVLCFL